MTTLSRYPEVIELAANNRAPQHLVHYLRDLANDFHTYYNAHAFIVDDAALRDARLDLICCNSQSSLPMALASWAFRRRRKCSGAEEKERRSTRSKKAREYPGWLDVVWSRVGLSVAVAVYVKDRREPAGGPSGGTLR